MFGCAVTAITICASFVECLTGFIGRLFELLFMLFIGYFFVLAVGALVFVKRTTTSCEVPGERELVFFMNAYIIAWVVIAGAYGLK